MLKNYSVKDIRQKFKEQGIFYTPKELCEFMKSLVDIEYKNVYDPACGRGNLLKVFPDNIKKYGQDINEAELEVAKKTLKNFTGAVGDTIKNPAFIDTKFDLIIANPPFSIHWEENKNDTRFKNAPCVPPKSKADYVFIFHCLYMLKDKGQAIIMNFPGVLYRGGREGKLRQYLVEKNYIDKVISIDGGKFTDTNIQTCVLVLRKNKKHTNIEFIDSGLNKSEIIKLEQIKENNFDLSIKNYVFEEVEKDYIDIHALNLELINTALQHIKNTFDMFDNLFVLEGYNYSTILAKGLSNIIKQYTGSKK